jgi:hypothetical protein
MATPHTRPDWDHAFLFKNSHLTFIFTLIYVSFVKFTHDPHSKTN